MDIKKPSYQIAYEERIKELGESMKSEHRGVEQVRDQETEVRPTRDSVQLTEGSRK